MLSNQSTKRMGLDINNQTLEEQQKRQQVPFFIWANYDIEEESNLALSANYLSTKVAKVAGLGLTKYQSFLSQMSEVLPVVNAVGYVDTDGTCHYLKEATGEEKHGLIIMRFFSITACLTNN